MSIPLRVLVCDDELMARKRVLRLLSELPGIEATFECESGEQVLAKLQGPATSLKQVRALRTVEVLEHIGTPEARKVLESLAKGTPEALLTSEAKASLDRLSHRAR